LLRVAVLYAVDAHLQAQDFDPHSLRKMLPSAVKALNAALSNGHRYTALKKTDVAVDMMQPRQPQRKCPSPAAGYLRPVLLCCISGRAIGHSSCWLLAMQQPAHALNAVVGRLH
jgi:hypothetical protein